MATAPTKKTAARKAPAKKAAATKSAVKKATRQVVAQKRQTKASFGHLTDNASDFASQVAATAQSMARSANAKTKSAIGAARQYVHDHPAQSAAIASASIAAVGALATRKKWPAIARTVAMAGPIVAGSRMLSQVSSKLHK